MAVRGKKNKYITDINGVRHYFKTWLDEVCKVADAVNLPDDVRDQIHGAWLQAGWENHERPAYFVRKAWEMISGDEHPEVYPDPVPTVA